MITQLPTSPPPAHLLVLLPLLALPAGRPQIGLSTVAMEAAYPVAGRPRISDGDRVMPNIAGEVMQTTTTPEEVKIRMAVGTTVTLLVCLLLCRHGEGPPRTRPDGRRTGSAMSTLVVLG